ncbi:cardiotrophin-2-like [Ambystoma mexicanum]|uniref:cardiotrophin-2-like n=1 Tax=Ambystoma mexicanum TaxID=8296 RepID=UPI0037E803AF
MPEISASVLAAPLTLCVLVSGGFFAMARAAPVPGGAAAVIAQTYNLALGLQESAPVLLGTYLSFQGSPFSDPGFSAPELQLTGLPSAAMPYRAWRALSDADRLTKSLEAYTILSEFLQLVLADQQSLNPNQASLLIMLRTAQANVQGLLSNIASIMNGMGVLVPAVDDPLMAASVSITTFQKKVRGYVVCREYRNWVDRSVRDFSFLKDKYPA